MEPPPSPSPSPPHHTPPPLERTPTPHPNQILQSCDPIPTDQTQTPPLERTPTPHPSKIPRPSSGSTDQTQTQTPPPPQPLERTPTPHPNQILQQPPCGTCLKCGSTTTYTPPNPNPSLPSLSEASPPPTYRPIRLPALNISPSAAAQAQQAIILTPVPQPKPVPILSPPFHFYPPVKKITSPSDANHFITSHTGQHFLGFIASLSLSIKSQKLSSPCHVSPSLTLILNTLTSLISSVDLFPPVDQSSRYGNISFRSWHQNLTSLSEQYNLQLIPDGETEMKGAVVELTAYLNDSFGNATRIDYGTGHETNFAAWLYCLARLGVIKEEDYHAVVSRVFVKYLELMRKLQLVYCLEPAGSHGVWGLDDYHFLPFVFGASQLIDHKYMKPKSIHNEDILENFADEYLYLQCVKFIKKVKKGPFAEHSPLLDDISGVPNWGKVNSGLLKMYRAEVLEKVPVVQHFLFGSIIPWD